MAPNLNVLLVDDERKFTESLSKILRRHGMAVTSADDGFGAMACLAQQDYDAVVLDLRMPNMDGLATLEAFRREDAITPVLILTGHTDLGQISQALRNGPTEVLLKPCPVDTLIAAIENAGERKAAARELLQISQSGRKDR